MAAAWVRGRHLPWKQRMSSAGRHPTSIHDDSGSGETIVGQCKAIIRLYKAIITLYRAMIRLYRAIIRRYKAVIRL